MSGPVGGARRSPDPSAVQAAVERGLAFLRRTQDSSGAWLQDVGFKQGMDYIVTADEKPHVGVAALALMAFLAGGHLPGRGAHAGIVERGTDYVLAHVDPESGYIDHNDTRMYGHAFATLFLAEIYGMTHRDDVKQKLQLAIDLIVKSQNDQGSWRYRPFAPTADMSVTVCQIMALRAARNVGLRVPRSTIDRAYAYVDRSAYKNPRDPRFGGFQYKLAERGTRVTFALTAAGIASLNHAGDYDSDLVRAGTRYLQEQMDDFGRSLRGHYSWWYGHYYASQVFFLGGDRDPELWTWYWDRIGTELLGMQTPDGSWPSTVGPGTAYSTAIATIILQVPSQYLPIFHR